MPRPPRKFVADPFEYHEEIELRIDSLSNTGLGIGRMPGVGRGDEEAGTGTDGGWVVFVPFCLPGERVRARVFRNEKNCSHADFLEVLEASPDRREPRCPLFGTCGGCQYQHMDYARQLEWKTRQVGELLLHMAGIEHEIAPCRASPQIWNYRSKITPHFDRPRDGKPGEIGFLSFSRRSQVVDVPQCPIAMEALNEALPKVREEARARTYKRGATLLLRAAGERVETNPNIPVREQVGDLQFDFLAGDFFQNNPFILPDFVDYAAGRASEGGAIRYLVDAYCGSGLFALSLARRFKEVVGVEISESAVDWARRNAETNGIANARFLAASAEAVFEGIEFPPEKTCVLIDPPRKGSTPGFLDQLAAFGPGRIVYVSCNPATQIRDLARLREHGYELRDVQPFDLFPHTRHLESIMTFERAAG